MKKMTTIFEEMANSESEESFCEPEKIKAKMAGAKSRIFKEMVSGL